MVSRYLVKSRCENSFSVWFAMSSATVEPGVGGNSAQIADIDALKNATPDFLAKTVFEAQEWIKRQNAPNLK